MADSVRLIKITADSAAEVCARFDLRQEARPLLREGLTPWGFLAALVVNNQYISGIDFLAHALAPREAIWWGCLCFQHACGENLSPADKEAATAAARWVLLPAEDTRAAAKALAETAGRTSPAGWLAAAVTQAGGSLAPPDAPPLPPGPFAPAKAVAGAVKLASTKANPVKIAETQRLFVELGIGIAEGRFGWPEIRNIPPVWKYAG